MAFLLAAEAAFPALAAAVTGGAMIGSVVRGITHLNSEERAMLDQALADAKRAQRERSLENLDKAKKDRFYDLVMAIHPFMDIVEGKGWPIALPAPPTPPSDAPLLRFFKAPPAAARQANQAAEAAAQHHLLRTLEGPIVAVRGQFNKGKSFILNALVGMQDSAQGLPSGDNIHTEAISVKATTFRGRPMVFIDTMGSNSPIDKWEQCAFQDRKALESFVCDVVFKLSHVFLEVVNEIGYNEQEEIATLCYALKNQKNADAAKLSKVMVIHNFRGVSNLDEFELKKKEVEKLFSGCKMASEVVDYGGKSATIQYLNGYESDEPGDFKFQLHFFVGKNGTPAGASNPFVMAKIMNAILMIQPPRKNYDFVHELEAAINQVLPEYLDPKPAQPVRIELDGPITRAYMPQAVAPGSSSPNNIQPSYQLKSATERTGPVSEGFPCHILDSETERVVIILMPGVTEAPEINFHQEGDECVFTVEGYHRCPVAETEFTTLTKAGVVYGKLRAQFRVPMNLMICPPKPEWTHNRLLLVFKKVNQRSGTIPITMTAK